MVVGSIEVVVLLHCSVFLVIFDAIAAVSLLEDR